MLAVMMNLQPAEWAFNNDNFAGGRVVARFPRLSATLDALSRRNSRLERRVTRMFEHHNYQLLQMVNSLSSVATSLANLQGFMIPVAAVAEGLFLVYLLCIRMPFFCAIVCFGVVCDAHEFVLKRAL